MNTDFILIVGIIILCILGIIQTTVMLKDLNIAHRKLKKDIDEYFRSLKYTKKSDDK